MLDMARYSCQLALPGFSEHHQQLLQNAKVLIVGAGGLGCPAAQYLAAIGIGTLGLADPDIISISNLHRQILYDPSDAGQKKAIVACTRLHRQNPSIQIVPHEFSITSENVFRILNTYDIIVDCTDNFETRYLLNDACVISGKPLVYGAIYQYEGQVAVWNITGEKGSGPNYRDVFPVVDATQIPKCSEGGVMPTVAGIVGCMQANEVVKYITKTGELLSGKMLLIDVRSCESRIIDIGALTTTKITSIEQSFKSTIDAKELYDAKANSYRLIDVRTEKERSVFNIGGEHIPLNLILENYKDSHDAHPVIFYCETGKRSAEAAKAISIQYPEGNFLSLHGGLREWKLFSGE